MVRGKKTFELRKNDREFQADDLARLEEYDPISGYTGENRHAKSMNIYRISQTFNLDYDSYSSAVVLATSICEAKTIFPGEIDGRNDVYNSWCEPIHVSVELIGISTMTEIKCRVLVALYTP